MIKSHLVDIEDGVGGHGGELHPPEAVDVEVEDAGLHHVHDGALLDVDTCVLVALLVAGIQL